MSKIKYTLFMFTLILLTNCKLLHTQSSQQEQNLAYYDALMVKENDLNASLAQLQASIAMLNTTLSQLQNSSSIQVIALSDTMADERNIIS